MSPKLPSVSGEEAVRVLMRLGFVFVRQRGSHVILKKQTPDSDGVVSFLSIKSLLSAHYAVFSDKLE